MSINTTQLSDSGSKVIPGKGLNKIQPKKPAFSPPQPPRHFPAQRPNQKFQNPQQTDTKNKQDPTERALTFKEKNELKKLQQTQNKLKNFRTASFAGVLRKIALDLMILAAPKASDFKAIPGEAPQKLYKQVEPIVKKMRLQNLVDKGRTQVSGLSNKDGLNLFKIVLKRKEQVDPVNIEKIKQNLDNFEYINWSAQALEAFLWAKYTPTGTGATPTLRPPPGA